MSLDLHWFADIVAVIVAIGTIIFAAVRLKRDSQKIQAEVSMIIDHRWQDLNASLEARIDEMVEQAKVKVLESMKREERITELERIVEEQKKKLMRQDDELVNARKRIAELKVEVVRMGKMLELVKKKTGPLTAEEP